MTNQVTIFVDGTPHEVDAGTNLLQACLKLQMDLPYFCWHPAMGSVGSCRLCAMTQYQNAEDERGRLIMACMTPVSEGMILSLTGEKPALFRATTIEAMMTNHPHDCPVCEEGGDCHLQDMTLLSGHIKRRYPGAKRTHLNQYLGPFLNHEMNRCISCYRCVRFYRDYCGGDDFNVFASRNNVFFGRAEPGELENEFAGNLVEVCPTGVFTDKPFSQQFSRKWDLQSAPTVCTSCSVGCNTYTSERNGIIRKVGNRHNPAVNAHFLCDRGRFGYEHVNHTDRLEHPWRRNNEHQSVDVITSKAAEQLVTDWLSHGDCIAVGSTRSSIENNAALIKLTGQKHFYTGLPDSQTSQLKLLTDTYQQNKLNLLSLTAIEACDAMLLIGEDPTHTAPRLALSIRQMTRNAGIDKAAKLGIKTWQDEAVRNIAQDCRSPLTIVNTHTSRLEDVAKRNLNLAPAAQLVLLGEIEAQLSANNRSGEGGVSEQARQISQELLNAKNPALVTGTNGDHPAILAACLRIALLLQQRNPRAGFYCASGQVNSLGLGVLAELGQGLDSLLERLRNNPPSILIVMETDLYRYYADETLDQLLDKVKHIIVLDQLLTRTVQMADMVLPVSSFAETQACWLSAEGRLQQSFATMPAIKNRLSSFEWLQTLTGLHTHEQTLSWTVQQFSVLEPLSAFTEQWQSEFSIARQPLRSTGRTAINATIDVKEYPPVKDNVSPMTFSMEGVPAFRQKLLVEVKTPVTGVWSPKWNSSQGINKTLDEDGCYGITLFSGEIGLNTIDLSHLKATSVPEDCIPVSPKHHIYADDELAVYSTSLQQLIPKPKVFLTAAMAQKLGVNEGDTLSLSSARSTLELPCEIDKTMANDLLLVPMQQFLQLGHHARANSLAGNSLAGKNSPTQSSGSAL
ncbi:MAG: NADH-quinone oxidoreductase subunit G [Alteromonadaceae bacterium]|jgi:NADH-quinone oxidoreductase subunit G